MARQLEAAVHAVSVVTVGELKKGAISARWGETRSRALDYHLRGYLILPIDAEVAEAWAQLRARCDELGRPKSDNDLWIAATAKRYDLPLATLDRDQHDIPSLKVIREDGTEITVPA